MTKTISKAASKTTTRKKAATSARVSASPLPLQLKMIGSLLGGSPAETRRALNAAQHALDRFIANKAEGDRDDVMGSFDDYVQNYAITQWAKPFEKALDAIGGEGKFGDLICAYSGPAYLAGMAFTWLMLRGDAPQMGGAR